MSRLSRWSRRKRVASTDTPSQSIHDVASENVAFENTAFEKSAVENGSLEKSASDEPLVADQSPGDQADEPVSLDETLPDPESLGAGSDFTAYLQQGISQGLRRRALRRLFATGDYNVRDGLDDYDQDFRQQKPLSAEISARLRQWTQKLEEETSDQPESASLSEEQPVVESETKGNLVENNVLENKAVESKVEKDSQDPRAEQGQESAEPSTDHDPEAK